jgi:hypothetical protein
VLTPVLSNRYGASSLSPATIAVTPTAGVKPGSIILPPEYINSNFGIAGCEYHYNLAASSLGVRTYQVDINTTLQLARARRNS